MQYKAGTREPPSFYRSTVPRATLYLPLSPDTFLSDSVKEKALEPGMQEPDSELELFSGHIRSKGMWPLYHPPHLAPFWAQCSLHLPSFFLPPFSASTPRRLGIRFSLLSLGHPTLAFSLFHFLWVLTSAATFMPSVIILGASPDPHFLYAFWCLCSFLPCSAFKAPLGRHYRLSPHKGSAVLRWRKTSLICSNWGERSVCLKRKVWVIGYGEG